MDPTMAMVGGGAAALGWATWWLRVGRRVPRLDRDWEPECAHQPTATIDGRQVTIHGVRTYDAYADETYALDELVAVWYVVEHFHPRIRGLAHVMLSFEFAAERFVTCSFEVRRTRGQKYHPWPAMWRGYELLLVWGTEEDLIRRRTNGRKNPVYLFPCTVPEGKGEALFLRLCERGNELAEAAAWYHTLRTTCATSLVAEVNTVTPGRVPFMWRLLLPGHTPRAAYRLGLIGAGAPSYEQVLADSAITPIAQAHGKAPGFSRAIRGR